MNIYGRQAIYKTIFDTFCIEIHLHKLEISPVKEFNRGISPEPNVSSSLSTSHRFLHRLLLCITVRSSAAPLGSGEVSLNHSTGHIDCTIKKVFQNITNE